MAKRLKDNLLVTFPTKRIKFDESLILGRKLASLKTLLSIDYFAYNHSNYFFVELKMAGIRPSDFVIKCPVELKNTHWQKAKGKVGKLIKTGVGAELKKLEGMLKKVDPVTLDPAANPSKSLEELAKKVAAAKKEYAGKIPAIQKQLAIIKDKATAAEKKFKSTPMGSSAAKAATAVEKAADFYRVTCKSLDMIGSVEKVKADIAKKNDLAAKLLKGSLGKFATGAKAFLADPTEASWDKNIKQQGRSVSNSLAQLQNYRAKFWKNFEKFKGFDTGALGIAKDPEFTKKSVLIVKKAIDQVKAVAAFKG